MAITADEFKAIANEVLRKNPNRTDKEQERTWDEYFGTSSVVAAELWNNINPTITVDPKSKPKHLLWALLFLKQYATESVHCSIVGIQDQKTFRLWSWRFVRAIANLKPRYIVWTNRFINWDMRSKCLISIDGTDCSVYEPWPFDRTMFSHKFNGPGYKYEIGVCIKADFIVWVHGPENCGVSDLTTFRQGLSHHLCDNEAVECDMYYKGDHRLKNPKVHQGADYKKKKGRVCARQEVVNSRLKTFAVLSNTFRHKLADHQACKLMMRDFYEMPMGIFPTFATSSGAILSSLA